MKSTKPPAEGIGVIPENLFREPVDFLYEDHYRQRAICGYLDDIGAAPEGSDAARLAAIVLRYLEEELPNHVADEEKDLFPRLRSHKSLGERTEAVCGLLEAEHKSDEEVLATIKAGLHALQEGQTPRNADAFRAAAMVFAETQRRHLLWEEVLILPLVRKILPEDERQAIGRRMAERRGARYPE